MKNTQKLQARIFLVPSTVLLLMLIAPGFAMAAGPMAPALQIDSLDGILTVITDNAPAISVISLLGAFLWYRVIGPLVGNNNPDVIRNIMFGILGFALAPWIVTLLLG